MLHAAPYNYLKIKHFSQVLHKRIVSKQIQFISKIQITTHCLEETQALGQKIGQLLEKGMIITLRGDLGSGKTSFVQGLARGLDVPETYYITSPSYTLINEYPGRYPLFHVDLYRICDLSEIEDIGLEEIIDSEGVVAIEWAERIAASLLHEYLDIRITVLDDQSRQFCIIGYGLKMSHLIKKIESCSIH